MNFLHKELQDWLTQESPSQPILSNKPLGFRDLMWCPYSNEPIILSYDKDFRPNCTGCKGNFEASTHWFLGHVKKPRI